MTKEYNHPQLNDSELDLEAIIDTLASLLLLDNKYDSLGLLKASSPELRHTGIDNWDGGTDIYTLYLKVKPETYAEILNKKEMLENHISEKLKNIFDSNDYGFVNTSITLLVERNNNWKQRGPEIPKSIRQNISDLYILDKVSWWGDMNEVEFLERIFNLKELPSKDYRFENADRDIWQHRINNFDWEDDWVFTDERLNLQYCPSETFLKFICETLHPVVRKDPNETNKLQEKLNELLKPTGWIIEKKEILAGHPRFTWNVISNSRDKLKDRAKSVADILNANWMHKEIARLEDAIISDPDLAIGTAKELIETCCKTILKEITGSEPKNENFQKLVKETVKALNLIPEGIPSKARGSDAIKNILKSLTVITHNMNEIRALYGTGHGRVGSHKGLETRHARLAAGTAITFIDFITDSYKKKTSKE